MRSPRLLALLALLALPFAAHAQVTASDSARLRDTFILVISPALVGLPVVSPMGPLVPPAGSPLAASARAAVHMPRPPAEDTTQYTHNLLGNYGNLGLELNARIESKVERNRNERCLASQYFDPLSSCRGKFQPSFNFQFNVRSSGTVGDRFHVDVDYDTEREFDASNSVSLSYQGAPGDKLQRIEVGNVDFTPPPSRFITSGIPSGNYGLQAVGQFGPVSVHAIAAQQKGNVVQSRRFTVGDRTLQQNEREIEDYQIEPRRFFFTIDPTLLTGYPNIDLLNRAELQQARASLADTVRPSRVYLYRVQFGTQPQNPNGPRFRLQGEPGGGRQVYDVLQEGVDYYMDPSLLWFALVRPLNPDNERLVLAYTVSIGGQDTVWPTTGGTPDLQATGGDQVANLVWDPSVTPSSPAFTREIRSVYRIAGMELDRRSTSIRVVAGPGGQERPPQPTYAGQTYDSYLQMLGIAQANNSAEFDAENRIWPRPSDAVGGVGAALGGTGDASGGIGGGIGATGLGVGGTGAGLGGIGGYFLIFPSVRPFATRDSGLVVPGNPANSSIYTTPGEYLYSPRHPASVYRLRVSYQANGSTHAGELSLGAVQIRRGSERISIDGQQLERDRDYRVDYDLGRVTFVRPDTLFPRPREVTVSYEENPLFAPSPTQLFGLVTQLPLSHGQFSFTTISQSQHTDFTRPQLGFEPVSSVLAGFSGSFAWNTPALTRALDHFTLGAGAKPSRFSIQGELAASRPRPSSAAQAYVEAFEGEGGINVNLSDPDWYYASLPAYGTALPSMFGAQFFEPQRAATLAWQNNGTAPDGTPVLFSLSDIDSLSNLAGVGFAAPERILWLTLYPLDVGGKLDRSTSTFDWKTPQGLPGERRFRSIRTVLNPAGIDLTQAEYLEFWTLVDTSAVYRARNPTLIFDFGDISENSLAFSPETLYVRRNSAGGVDSLYSGKRVQGLDSLNTERDPFSHAFNSGTNDTGLPGDLLDTLIVVDSTQSPATITRTLNVPLCQAVFSARQLLGDSRVNCTRGNGRLDEEDIDLDNALNLTAAQREQEDIMRYVVDLSKPETYTRVGREAIVVDTVAGQPVPRRKQWVLVRVPFNAPDDSIGTVQMRRIRALRVTIVSGAGATDEEFTQLPLARLKLAGAPWVKRSETTLAGVAGDKPGGGYVLASIIGTTDRDSVRGLEYESPPGVRDQLETTSGQFQGGLVQINEQSLRIVSSDLAPMHRAEAYYRFPSGDQNFMGYEELRLWARGRGNGWGRDGELQMYVKMGRDENNFYMYRTPVNSGRGQSVWLPEVRVAFQRFYDLRRRLQNAYLQGTADTLSGCTDVDSALIAASPAPIGSTGRRYAACDDGYMVYTADPGMSPPNLAAVQEMSVGFVRVGVGTGMNPVLPGDTLELWVDDIRLSRVVSDAGYAGQVGVELIASDFAEVRASLTGRDPNFRQLGEQPTFVGDRTLDIQSTFHLDRLLPAAAGFSVPFTVNRTSLANSPLFLSRSDIPGEGIAGLRTPRNSLTSYTISVRRTAPVGQPLLDAVLNHLAVTSTYTDGASRNEYNTGSSRHFTLGLDYVLSDDTARTVGLPGWMDGVLGALPGFMQRGPVGALRTGALRWNPTQLRITSGIARGTERRLAFLKPADVPGDTDDPQLALSLSDLWRNGATLQLRPTPSLSLRWDITSIRDMRQYGDTTASAALAGASRGSMLGVDIGLERERLMQTSLSFAPDVLTWLHPRADFGTQYGMVRDPNSPSALVGGAQISTLPRRLTASQTLGTGLTLDIAGALARFTRDSSFMGALVHAFSPLDINFNRSLLSAFDAATFAPPLGFQLGMGGVDGFRVVDGRPATNAGATTTLSASNLLTLPFGSALVNRFRRTSTRNWTLRPDGTQPRRDGGQTVFPDASLRWSYRPTWLGNIVTGVGANIGFSNANAFTSTPGGLGTSPDLRRSRVRTYPFSGSIVWGFAGGMSTDAGYTLTRRIDSLPGSTNHGTMRDMRFDLARSFRMPSWFSLGLRNDIRARIGYEQSSSQTFVSDALSDRTSRVLDQGRTAISVNADTNLNERLFFTLQASRIVTFDNNLNRRLNQFVLSTVLEIRFGGR